MTYRVDFWFEQNSEHKMDVFEDSVINSLRELSQFRGTLDEAHVKLGLFLIKLGNLYPYSFDARHGVVDIKTNKFSIQISFKAVASRIEWNTIR